MSAATITGPCIGGCGAELSRELAPAGNAFADIANGLPLICEQCSKRESAELERERAASERHQRGIEFRQRLESSGLPRELRDVDLGRLDPAGCEDAIAAAYAWGASSTAGLMLTGPFGTGKTTIAAGALRLLLCDTPGRWVSAPTLMARLGSGLGSQQREWALDLLSARRAVVIDDLDKTRPTEYGAEQIFLAVDNAVTRGQQLLVTTNLSPSQLAAKWPPPFGEAIVSRLVGYCTALTVAGADRRLAGGGS